MKYKFKIPTPSASRLQINRKFIIRMRSAFKTEIVKEYVIPENVEDFIFDFDEPLEYKDLYREDADYRHEFYMVYQNSTGSRKEEIKIDPINFQF